MKPVASSAAWVTKQVLELSLRLAVTFDGAVYCQLLYKYTIPVAKREVF